MNDSRKTDQALRPFDSKKNGWTQNDATHLLWRTQYGATGEEIYSTESAGLEKTLDRMFTRQTESPEFQSSNRLLRQLAHDTGNIDHLKTWWLNRMLHSANPLVEKMSLFWHNHFATSNTKVQSVKHMSAQGDLIRRHALGSFRDLLSGMTRDVAMLIWLDGNANRKRHANENFAREVMELFSLGVGNYTEEDIKEAARAFTGWHVREEEFWINQSQHDKENKTIFGKTDNFNGDDVIEIFLAQPACPRFLARKLLKAFVFPDPADTIVDQLARRIRIHNFQLTPVLRELFGSQLFFSRQARFSIIKSPLDLLLGAHRALRTRAHLPNTTRLLAELGQDLFQPPSVKGWEGGRLWINSDTMLQRTNFAAELTSGVRFGPIDDPGSAATALRLNTSEEIVHHYTDVLLAQNVKVSAMEKLIDYLERGTGGRFARIRGMIHLIMSMPEYQLM